MTALPPIENRRVIGVPATKYEANAMCAHPECADDVPDRGHHIFPRATITNDSYFVRIEGKETLIIPHVTGLCRRHHDQAEQHMAWIKLEGKDFIWYDRVGDSLDDFVRVGALDPQPGGRYKARKPRPRKDAEERKTRDRISLSVPTGFAEGGRVWDEHFGNGKKGQPLGWVRVAMGDLIEIPRDRANPHGADMRPPFEVIIDGFYELKQVLLGLGVPCDFIPAEKLEEEFDDE